MATVPKKGYDCEFISEVPDDYKCPICKCVFRDPHRVSCCEEEYCKECIEQVITDDKPCPNPKCGCNDYISTSEAMRTRRQVDQLRCHCSNRREGCEWKGELQELNDHLNENPTNENQLNGCDFTPVHCRWCQEILPRNEIGEHQENVDYSLVNTATTKIRINVSWPSTCPSARDSQLSAPRAVDCLPGVRASPLTKPKSAPRR